MTSKFLLLIGGFALATALASTAHAAVNCGAPGQTIQNAVDSAKSGDTIFIFGGTCVGDVTITTDDITLSGNRMGNACDKDDPSTSADATIDGTITVDGVRAKIEHLVITGGGEGVRVTNRADARLTCNDISDNDETGVTVVRTSNAVLTDNTLSGNGRRSFDSPFIFFDVGLFVAGASHVQSNGNTYENNQYAAIESDQQSFFRNGSFLPREGGHPPNDAEHDTIVAKGSDPGTPATCIIAVAFTTPVAVELFNNGHAEFRNADICGEMESAVNSSLRIDDGANEIIGNVRADGDSFVRIRDRSGLGDGRLTTFEGKLFCSGGSQTFGSNVQCGETCTGGITVTGPGGDTCTP